MTKTKFLDTLRQSLRGLPQSEIDEAVAYYAGYLADAGEENEQQVLKELGDPAAIATQILNEQTDGNGSSKPAGSQTMSAPLRVLLAILYVFIGIPVLGSLIITTCSLVLSGGLMLLSGIVSFFVILIFGTPVHAATAVLWMGIGLLVAAVGVALAIACSYLTWQLCRLTVYSAKSIFGGISL